MQAHHQEILQKITLQQSLTDTSTDRCSCDGPSYAFVLPGTYFCYFETRAHTTEPTTGRHNCDGPSSGNRRVINDVSDPTRLDTFSKSDRLNSQPFISPVLLHYFPHYSFLLNFHNLFLYQPPIIALSQFSKALKCYLLVETGVVSVYLATEYLCICFFPISKVCVSNLYSFS